MSQLKLRQKRILESLKKLGGTATTRQIAEATGFHVNGVSQSLRSPALRDLIFCKGPEKKGETLWELVPDDGEMTAEELTKLMLDLLCLT